ncbi:MAG: tetratricopeptide repeat protein [Terriglobia bacterium]
MEIQELREAATLDPSYADPHYALGRLYEGMGNHQKATTKLSLFEKIRASQNPYLLH